MKKILATIFILSTVVFFLKVDTETAHAYTSGSPGGYSGSLSENRTCGSGGGCHGGGFTDISTIISTNIPEAGYSAGETYTISLMHSTAGRTKYGFELSAENGSGTKQGTFSNNDSNSKILGNKNATHTSSGAFHSSGTATWDITWTAPESNVGDITFSAVINATNGSGTSGDIVFRDQETVSINTTSIKENTLADLAIFPNPVVDNLNIKGGTKPYTVTVTDGLGKSVMQISKNGNSSINLSSLAKGNYLVKIDQDDFSKTEWIVKQ